MNRESRPENANEEGRRSLCRYLLSSPLAEQSVLESRLTVSTITKQFESLHARQDQSLSLGKPGALSKQLLMLSALFEISMTKSQHYEEDDDSKHEKDDHLRIPQRLKARRLGRSHVRNLHGLNCA